MQTHFFFCDVKYGYLWLYELFQKVAIETVYKLLWMIISFFRFFKITILQITSTTLAEKYSYFK